MAASDEVAQVGEIDGPVNDHRAPRPHGSMWLHLRVGRQARKARMSEELKLNDQEARGVAIGEILTFIRTRGYQTNDRLPSERDLAEKFGLSRAAIREGLAALEVMRVVQRRPNSGIFLRSMSERSIEALIWQAESGIPFPADEIADVFEVRRMLEVQAVRLACIRRTSGDIAAIKKILSETKNRVERELTIEAEDERFHLAIFAATKNDVLLRLVQAFYEMSRPRRKIYFSDSAQSVQSYEDHCLILDAIENKQSNEAERSMSRHLSQAVGVWQRLLGGSDISGSREP